MTLKDQLSSAIKDAMRNKEKEKLTTLRMFSAAIKQKEVDERIELSDDRVLNVLTTMIKQRKESLKQYQEANREDLASKEASEIEILNAFLPPALSDDELQSIIQAAIAELGATSMKDMGGVMAAIKPKIQGRSDPAKASALVKNLLG